VISLPLFIMGVDRQYYTTTNALIGTSNATVSYVNVGNPKGDFGVRSHICTVCQLAFKEYKMTRYQGKWYGIPCGCYRDIPSLRRQGKAWLRRRGHRKEEVVKG